VSRDTVRQRPALMAGLNQVVAVFADRRGESAALTIDDVVEAGLRELGLGPAVDLALRTHISKDTDQAKKDLEVLSRRLRTVVAGLELEGTQTMMAS